jgi:hypothetical protein
MQDHKETERGKHLKAKRIAKLQNNLTISFRLLKLLRRLDLKSTDIIISKLRDAYINNVA